MKRQKNLDILDLFILQGMFGCGIHNKNLPLIKFLCKITISNENIVKLRNKTEISTSKFKTTKTQNFSKSSELVAFNSRNFGFFVRFKFRETFSFF